MRVAQLDISKLKGEDVEQAVRLISVRSVINLFVLDDSRRTRLSACSTKDPSRALERIAEIFVVPHATMSKNERSTVDKRARWLERDTPVCCYLTVYRMSFSPIYHLHNPFFANCLRK